VTFIEIDPHAEAILEVLRTATMPDGALVKIGDGIAPKSTDGKIVAPCAILHLRGGGSVTGSIGAVNTDAILRFQITSVGKTAREARVVADCVGAYVEGATVTVEGRETVRIGRPPGSGPIQQPQRDDDVTPPLFYVPVEYRLWTVPAVTGS
jgi:hypothetical protein